MENHVLQKALKSPLSYGVDSTPWAKLLDSLSQPLWFVTMQRNWVGGHISGMHLSLLPPPILSHGLLASFLSSLQLAWLAGKSVCLQARVHKPASDVGFTLCFALQANYLVQRKKERKSQAGALNLRLPAASLEQL